MKDCIFTLTDGKRALSDSKNSYPKVIREAYSKYESI
mgnify:CR=1 FL=1